MNTFLLTFLILTLQLLSFTVFPKTAEEWKSRTIYQIITDRFARTDGDETPCSNLNDYCGGTFRGIQNNLEYIQGMGFDAIWISPIVANTERGYHGYWASDLYNINTNFGTEEEFHELVRACHERDIWVMVDVVANHMGYTEVADDYSAIIPFNSPEYYNPHVSCDHIDPRDQGAVETCWLSGLPDLDQNHPFVKETLLDWIQSFVSKYNIDAIRIDTVPHVSKEFWAEFGRRSGVYTLGELLNFDLPYLASYQGPLDSVLNYALYSTLRHSFQNGGSMSSIESYYDGAYATWPDITVLGNFVNNHDNPRFLDGNYNVPGFKAGLAFTLCSVGIPIIYYGDEQAYSGGMDPANREPLWTSMNSQSEIYQYIQTINQFRKETRFFDMPQIQRYSDENFYAFTRGNYLFAFTNSQDHQSRMVSFHPYEEGTVLCNIFYEDDCVVVENNEINIQLINGEVKIFRPAPNDANKERKRSAGWDAIRNMLGSSSFIGAKSLNI